MLSLAFGAAGLLLFIVFLLTAAGRGIMIAAVAAGIAGSALGAVALARRQAKGFAVTGIVLGALTVLLAIGLVLFALVFVGAISV